MNKGIEQELVEQVPIVDFAPFLAGAASGRLAVAAAIRQAAESVGFLYLSGHGVDPAVIDAAFAASRRFFELPLQDRLKVSVNSAHRGFIQMSNATVAGGTKPSMNESFLAGLDLGPLDPDVIAKTPLHGPNQWPEGLDGFREAIEAYQAAMWRLGHHVLRAFALALEIDEEFFVPYFVRPMPFVRLLHYPSQSLDRADDEFGISPHTDYGFVTFLAQDAVGGLQVKRRDGGWIDVTAVPDTFVVNIGDMLMRWTNDRWISNQHRVINTTGCERYSVPYFFDPAYHVRVECISTCKGPGHPAKYDPITWGEYLKQKFDASYAYRKNT